MTQSTPPDESQETDNTTENHEKVGILGVVQSVFAAIFGIQSDKNRQKDFKQGDATQFIVIGIIVVVGIMITMMMVVSSVLDSAGK